MEQGSWGYTVSKGRVQHFAKDREQESICGATIEMPRKEGLSLAQCKKCLKEMEKQGISAEEVKTVDAEIVEGEEKERKQPTESEGVGRKAKRAITRRFKDTVGLIPTRETGHAGPRINHDAFRIIDDAEYESLKRQVRFLAPVFQAEARGIVEKIDLMEKGGFIHAPKRMRAHLAFMVSNTGMRKAAFGGKDDDKKYSYKELKQAKKAIQR